MDCKPDCNAKRYGVGVARYSLWGIFGGSVCHFGYIMSRLRAGPDLSNALAIDHAITPMIVAMESNGFRVDTEYLRGMSARLAVDIDGLTARVLARLPAKVNLASRDQLAAVLFRPVSKGGLGLDSSDMPLTDTGRRPRMDRDSLALVRGQHEVIPLMVEWYETTKLKSDFVDKLISMVGTDSRVHCDILTTRVPTSRLATKSPNLMAQPVRTAKGRDIRKAFVASKGYVLVAVDLSQIELRVGAHMSRDEHMCQVFRRGGDIHTETACSVFGVTPNTMDPKLHRDRAKTVNFRIFYGGSPAGLLMQILADGGDSDVWDRDYAKWFFSRWFGTYPGVQGYMDIQKGRVKEYGHVWDMFGGIRLVPEVFSCAYKQYGSGYRYYKMREFGYRVAINSPIQSGAARIMKCGMADIWPVMQAMGVRPLLSVHDELIAEAPVGLAESWRDACIYGMNNAVRISVPIESDGAIGDTWYDVG